MVESSRVESTKDWEFFFFKREDTPYTTRDQRAVPQIRGRWTKTAKWKTQRADEKNNCTDPVATSKETEEKKGRKIKKEEEEREKEEEKKRKSDDPKKRQRERQSGFPKEATDGVAANTANGRNQPPGHTTTRVRSTYTTTTTYRALHRRLYYVLWTQGMKGLVDDTSTFFSFSLSAVTLRITSVSGTNP